MEYHTPGVYIREVDSGARPIASVATSVPGFLGLFKHQAKVDAIAISASDGQRQLFGKVVPQLVDTKGGIPSEATDEAVTALTEASKIRRPKVKDLKALLEL